MPAISEVIPNFINGISQQAPALRLASQAERSTNYYPNVVDGNAKRPRTDHNCQLDSLPEGTFTHFILRDAEEKYIVAIQTDGTIRVWDFDGDEKTVNDESSGYLSGLTLAEDDLRALTIADHTFITNKKKVVAAGSATSPTRPHEAMVHVVAGVYGRDYTIYIDNTLEAMVRTPNGGVASDAPYADTARIAEALRELLDDGSITWVSNTIGAGGFNAGSSSQSGGGGFNTSPWSMIRYNSTIYLANSTDDFTIRCEDGYGGRNMKEIKLEIAKFSDLPLYGQDGFVCKVRGSESNVADDYWVQFNKTNDENGQGVWKECVAPGAVLGLDADTMPHLLVREADGTFTFRAAEWDDRTCGDVETVPDPSFVGQTVEDLLFHKNRLGLMSKENIVLSEHGKFYNFFRKTLTALLDTDPIDTAASHVKVSLLHHAVPYQKELILFSDETQFVFTGKELLTPKSAAADPVTELECHPSIRPMVVGSNIYFIAEKGEWASVFEYFLDKALETADFDDVTAHVPAFIPAGARTIMSSPTLNLVGVTTSGAPNKVFMYQFHWNGQEKLQSAWVDWEFPGATEIVNGTFDGHQMRLILRRDDAMWLETINCERKITDTDVSWSARLDRHVLLPTGTYNAGTGLTKFEVPYAISSDFRYVTASGGDLPAGTELELDSSNTALGLPTVTELYFEGDLSDQPIHVGRLYEARYRLSPLYVRDKQSQMALIDGRTQVLHLVLSFTRTAYFTVEVTCQSRTMRTYTFAAPTVDDAESVTDLLIVKEGKMSVPIMSRNDRVIIDIVNDSWMPCAFTGARWNGTYSNSKEL